MENQYRIKIKEKYTGKCDFILQSRQNPTPFQWSVCLICVGLGWLVLVFVLAWEDMHDEPVYTSRSDAEHAIRGKVLADQGKKMLKQHQKAYARSQRTKKVTYERVN